jgi:cyanate permease
MDKSGVSAETAIHAGTGEMAPYQRRYRWVMLSLLWLLYAGFGLTIRSIAPLVTPIVEDLHLSYTQMGMILGSWQLTYVLVSIIAGTIIDRWGVRKSLFAGALTVGISLALRYLPQEFSGLLGAVALVGAGGPMISIGAPKTISIWFEGKSRGTAIGIYLTGPWVGGIAALTLTNSFVMPLTGQNWRSTFLLYSLLAFTGAVLWWFFARDTGGSTAPGDTGIINIFKRLIRVRNVLTVVILGLLTFAITHGFNNWLPKILEAGGMSPDLAGFASSLPLAAGVPSLLIIPRLVPPTWRGRYLALAAALILFLLPLCITTSGGAQIAALILLGVLIAPFVPLLTLILMDTPEVGSTYMGAAGGLFFCVAEIGGVMGPLIMGAIVDLTGTFLAGTLFFALLCVAIILLTLRLKIR